MGKKFDGQNLMLIVNLVLILMLSYCSIPARDKLPQTPEPQATEAVTQNGETHAGDLDAPAPPAAVAEVQETAESGETVVEVKEPAAAVAAPAVVEASSEAEETTAEPEETAATEEPATVEKAEPEAAAAEQASGMPDVIAMDNAIYDVHKKGIVQFSHQKHLADYAIGCGECHHGDDGEPLADMKPGDDATGCAECHAKPGKAPKSKDKKLSDSERLAYHAEALHESCITCHKAYNKENNTKDAPASCAKCHPKN